jgi:small subunit ribosomal protein S12
MPTYSQLCKNKRVPKTKLNKTPALNGCPQKKGMCLKLILRSPKKPNSALRKLAKVKFNNEKKLVYAFIPGEKHNLHPYSTVLMRGGRVQDLPGVKYHLIRGKLDLLGIKDRITSRSKYGARVLKRYL